MGKQGSEKRATAWESMMMQRERGTRAACCRFRLSLSEDVDRDNGVAGVLDDAGTSEDGRSTGKKPGGLKRGN